jgi:hypothetical protein
MHFIISLTKDKIALIWEPNEKKIKARMQTKILITPTTATTTTTTNSYGAIIARV